MAIKILENTSFTKLQLSEDGKEVISSPKDCNYIIIEEGVEIIKENAFLDCVNLRTVFLPKSIKKIEAYAFKGCVMLSRINFPEGLNYIGVGAFSGCNRLKIVCLNSVSLILEPAVFEKSGVEDITMYLCTYINKGLCFNDANELKNITFIKEDEELLDIFIGEAFPQGNIPVINIYKSPDESPFSSNGVLVNTYYDDDNMPYDCVMSVPTHALEIPYGVHFLEDYCVSDDSYDDGIYRLLYIPESVDEISDNALAHFKGVLLTPKSNTKKLEDFLSNIENQVYGIIGV